MIIHEYRDDRVHCFVTARTTNLFIKNIVYTKFREEEGFLSPVLLKKKTAKKPLYFNQFLSWTLKKGEETILEHYAEEFIIPGTYTEEELKNTIIVGKTITFKVNRRVYNNWNDRIASGELVEIKTMKVKFAGDEYGAHPKELYFMEEGSNQCWFVDLSENIYIKNENEI